MNFCDNKSAIFNHIDLPAVFITEYMNSLDGNSIKIYLQCCLWSKTSHEYSVDDISSILSLPKDSVNAGITMLEQAGLISRDNKSIIFNDISEKELLKLYKPRESGNPETALDSRNISRNKAISTINDTFFKGSMSASWWSDIDNWFSQYQFDPEVMVMLFQSCNRYGSISKGYVKKVAENWFLNNIKTTVDLEIYEDKFNKYKEVRNFICKKLGITRPLTEYEEKIIEKWYYTYDYSSEIIELALRKSANISSPSFKYFDTIITKWHNTGLKDISDIASFDKNTHSTSNSADVKKARGNFTERKYDDSFFEKLMKNDDNNDNK